MSRGVVSIAGYVPYRRLPRSAVAQVFGSRRGQGHPIGGLPRRGHHHHGRGGGPAGARPSARARAPTPLWFATATPAYLDKTNATAIHAALRLARPGGRLRLRRRAPLGGRGPARQPRGRRHRHHLVVLSDLRDGLPTSADEAAGGDGAAAVVVGDDGPGTPVIAEYLGAASVSDEFLDRWRDAGDRRSQGVGGAVRRDPLRAARASRPGSRP